MTLVSDTGPLIALAKIAHLSILPQLGFDAVYIPFRVQRELLGKIGPESAAIDHALATFLRTTEAPTAPETIRLTLEGLDQGEAEVLSLAVSLGKTALVLLDDQAGRSAARHLGLSVTGTIGMLLLAKRRGLVEQVTPLLHKARNSGYWLSDAVITHAKQLANE